MSTRTSPIARCPCAPSSVGASRCFPRASQMDGDTNSPVCTCWPAKPNSGSFGRRLTKPSRFCERTKRSYDDSEHIRVSRPPRWTLESNGGTLPCNPIDYLPNCSDSQGRLTWISSCRNTRQPTQVRQRPDRPGTLTRNSGSAILRSSNWCRFGTLRVAHFRLRTSFDRRSRATIVH